MNRKLLISVLVVGFIGVGFLLGGDVVSSSSSVDFNLVSEVLAASEVGLPTGELLKPTAYQSQYARGITAGGGDLTELIITITNYVLSFLGIVALVAVIYGGLLYVANFGNTDLANKGKTVIGYAAIGIFIILLSFAFVNALLRATEDAGTGIVPENERCVLTIVNGVSVPVCGTLVVNLPVPPVGTPSPPVTSCVDIFPPPAGCPGFLAPPAGDCFLRATVNGVQAVCGTDVLDLSNVAGESCSINRSSSGTSVICGDDKASIPLLNNQNRDCAIRQSGANVQVVCDGTATDLRGAPGDPGLPGASVLGQQGLQGQAGIDGSSGRDGSSGKAGSRGATGARGSSGSDGIDGSQGGTGKTGLTGNAGLDGTAGLGGRDGVDGSQGETGATGLTGNSGLDGTAGVDGRDGVDGISGVDGGDGVSGSDGVEGRGGVRGRDGARGTDGSSGIDGSNGIDGSSGSDGVRGGDGSNGTDGSSARNGSSGTDGRDRRDGVDGSNGVSGIGGGRGQDGIDGNGGGVGLSGRNGSRGLGGFNGQPLPGQTGSGSGDRSFDISNSSSRNFCVSLAGQRICGSPVNVPSTGPVNSCVVQVNQVFCGTRVANPTQPLLPNESCVNYGQEQLCGSNFPVPQRVTPSPAGIVSGGSAPNFYDSDTRNHVRCIVTGSGVQNCGLPVPPARQPGSICVVSRGTEVCGPEIDVITASNVPNRIFSPDDPRCQAGERGFCQSPGPSNPQCSETATQFCQAPGPTNPACRAGDLAFCALTDPDSSFGIDYVRPIITSLRDLGDLCESTPLGLSVGNTGCSSNEIVADTDGDGVVNTVDADDDNDGEADSFDDDDDGDGFAEFDFDGDGRSDDFCLDTVKYNVFKKLKLDKFKFPARKTREEQLTESEYLAYIQVHNGCAEYQLLADIDGDGVLDHDDCDRDEDGVLDNEICDIDFASEFSNLLTVEDGTIWNGVSVLRVVVGEVDSDDDNDGVKDFGTGGDGVDADETLFRIANGFDELQRFVLRACAQLPPTRTVQQFCRYKDGRPVGKLVSLLDRLQLEIDLNVWNEFRSFYTEFLNLLHAFPRVEASFTADQIEGALPPSGQAFPVNFFADDTVDPYETICPVDNQNYYWFVNDVIDWSAGLSGIRDLHAAQYGGQLTAAGEPAFKGVDFHYDFQEPGQYNVQLLVTSGCTYNQVNPGAGEDPTVEAAMAGLFSRRVRIFPPRAKLVIHANDAEQDAGFSPVRVLARDIAEVSFDLRDSTTTRGTFESLAWSCGQGIGLQKRETPQPQWFDIVCRYNLPQIAPSFDGRKRERVNFTARDREGNINREIELLFLDTIARLDVTPAVTGTVETEFIFDGSRSASLSGRITNWDWQVGNADGLVVSEDFPNAEQISYRFSEPGTYVVTLIASAGSEFDSIEQVVTVEPRNVVAILNWDFPFETQPGRIRLDGSGSFHPDFLNEVLDFEWYVDGARLTHLQLSSAEVSNTYMLPTGVDANDPHDIVLHDFDRRGNHFLKLIVRRGTDFAELEETVDVAAVLGVDFDLSKATIIAGESVELVPDSPQAVGFYWDFGDGFELVGDGSTVSHVYPEQGVYSITLEVEDGDGRESNSVTKKLRVGLAGQPLANVLASIGGEEVVLDESICTSGGIEINRIDQLSLSGKDSLSVKGNDVGLTYLWDLNGERRSRNAQVSLKFDELTKNSCFEISLTVTDELTGLSDSTNVGVFVDNVEPKLSEVRFLKPANNLTPVSVPVFVSGDSDPDGEVQEYRWWYYPEGQAQEKLGLHITRDNRSQFVIGPRGVEGKKVKYFFVVELRDNDNAVVNSQQLLGKSEALTIVSGPNTAPKAEFTVSKSRLDVGEKVFFKSTTIDPLGEYIPSSAYRWDFEGEGRFASGITGSEVQFIYSSPGTYRPTLKVVKNGLSTTYDMELEVIPDTDEPESAFIFVKSGSKVQFLNNSIVDEVIRNKDIRYEWDFDVNIDNDGNGEPDDDVDSTLPNPVHTYDGNRDVEVQLKVTDVMGNSDAVKRKIVFIVTDPTLGLGQQSKVKLKPLVITNPEKSEFDGKVYLKSPQADVIFIGKRSKGRIQEYQIDTNLFVDSDGDGIKDNDIDNKTHTSWKDGSAFAWRYHETDGKIRARLGVVGINGSKRASAIDIVFSDKDPAVDFAEKLQNPDTAVEILNTIPVVMYSVDKDFAAPGEKITFNAARTRFPGETIKEYLWDFNADGLVDELTFDPVIVHSFEKDGVYEVILEAVSVDGLNGQYSQSVFVRGGLDLPLAHFSFNVDGYTVNLVNESTFDPSLEVLEYEWSFSQLDFKSVSEFNAFEILDDYEISNEELNLAPISVSGDLTWKIGSEWEGILPRKVALLEGEDALVLTEGETFVTSLGVYSGVLSLVETDTVSVDLYPSLYRSFQTGVSSEVTLENGGELVLNVRLENASVVIPSADGNEPIFISDGEVTSGKTVFAIDRLVPIIIVLGTPLEDDGGEHIGFSTVDSPIKIFDMPGTYRINLRVQDSVGAVSEKSEVITISQTTIDATLAEGKELAKRLDEEELQGVDSVEVDVSNEDVLIDSEESPVAVVEVGDDGITPATELSSGRDFSFGTVLIGLLVLVGIALVIVFVVRKMHGGDEPPKGGTKIAPSPSSESPVKTAEVEVVQSLPKAKKKDTVGLEVKSEKEESKVVKEVDSKKEDSKNNGQGKESKKGGGDAPVPDWLKM